MENISNSSTPECHDLICPITLDVYRDPVLAGDGHVYERIAIVQWIKQHGTSPLTREPLNVNYLCSEETIKQLCQSYRSNSLAYSCQSSTISLPFSPMNQSNTCIQRRTPCKRNCNIKCTLLIIMTTSYIIILFIIAIFLVFYFHPFSSISSFK